MKLDLTKEGLNALFKPYQVELLEWLWRIEKSTTSGVAWKHLMGHPDQSLHMSRASVIFVLNDLVDDGILSYTRRTGKGGYHRRYSPTMTKREFGEHIHRLVSEKCVELFPWLKNSASAIEGLPTLD